MRILGIDYGRSKIGLAISYEGKLAVPYKVIKVDPVSATPSFLVKIVADEKIELVVLGISEGDMANETREFAKKLREKLDVPIEFSDETLSTYDAENMARDAGKGKNSLKRSSDAYAAAVILQGYLDK